jgi:hypothetical protein
MSDAHVTYARDDLRRRITVTITGGTVATNDGCRARDEGWLRADSPLKSEIMIAAPER